MATRAGQRLGILRRVTHLLTPPKPVHHLQGTSQECDGTISTCLDECGSQQHLRSSTPSRTEQPRSIDTLTTNIHSLHPRHTVAAVCTIYKMHCSDSPRLLRQHLPNPPPLPPRRTRGGGRHMGNTTTCKFPLRATHHPDLEIYRPVLHCGWGQNPGTPSLTAPWVYLHHMRSAAGSRWWLTHHLLKGAFRVGGKCWAWPATPTIR